MEVRGTAVRLAPQFVKSNFSKGYNIWLNTLPERSKRVVSSRINGNNWYELYESVILPTQRTGQLFYNNEEQGAWQLGRNSADEALNSFLRHFLKYKNPNFALSKASSVFGAYYSEAELKVREQKANVAVLEVTRFTKSERLIHFRIGGWIERMLELSKCSSNTVNVEVANGLVYSKGTIVCNWEA